MYFRKIATLGHRPTTGQSGGEGGCWVLLNRTLTPCYTAGTTPSTWDSELPRSWPGAPQAATSISP